jgi:hypothetical protein
MNEQPEWLRNWPARQAVQPKVVPATAWQPGVSGWPAGRPKGIVDRRHLITKMLGDGAEAVVKKALALAKDGDPVALPIVLARIAPALKPVDEPAPFELDTTASLEDQGLAVLKAIAEGTLTPQQGKLMLELVHGLAALRDVDTLARRLEALEQEVHAGRQDVPLGGVLREQS